MTSEARGIIEPIANLRLDRRRLTLLVIGAGFGEGVLIALPGSEGWVVIDGAAPSGDPPAVELRFGRTVLLLGADLPNERNGRLVESGWSHLCGAVTGLHEHAGYKVAHHASREAIHPDVVRPHGRARAWATTPYNKGQTLPRFEEGEGVSLLQACERELLLTALPVGFRDQRPMTERVRRAEIEPASVVGRGPLGRLAPVVAGGPPVKSPPAECVWAIQLDDQGNVTNRHRGAAAVAVV